MVSKPKEDIGELSHWDKNDIVVYKINGSPLITDFSKREFG
jgi:hypothetical protein